MQTSTKSAEARRILERYLVEVVERYELCPWARLARRNHEIGFEILLGAPKLADFIVAARRAFASPTNRIAMLVAPELAIAPAAFRALRDALVPQLPEAGIADFHPEAPLDLATPARLVPWLRRSPDPMMQVVPLALLDAVRTRRVPDRKQQARILATKAQLPRDPDVQIAAANHATASTHHAAIEATFAAIAADRAEAYARVGLSACR
jgi:hypothetical protein